MARIDVEELTKLMVAEAVRVLKGSYPKVKAYVEPEFRKLADAALAVQMLKEAGTITEERAKDHMAIIMDAMDAVAETAKGEVKLAVEAAINAAIAVAAAPINAALGWKVI